MTPLVLLSAYLLGSVPFAYWVTKTFTGKDPRYTGNGNVGARNTMRLAGLWPGVLVIALDGLKGAGVYWVAMRWAPSVWVFYLAVLVMLLGHWYPVWLRFRGGIGQAALTGFCCAWNPLAAVVAVPLFILLKRVIPVFNVAYALAAVVYLGIALALGLDWWHMVFIVAMFMVLLSKKGLDSPRQKRMLAEAEGPETHSQAD